MNYYDPYNSTFLSELFHILLQFQIYTATIRLITECFLALKHKFGIVSFYTIVKNIYI